jgi:hypothetical protein
VPFTIRNAGRLAFYQELWEGSDPASVTTTSDLAMLPTLSKDAYRAGLMWHSEATAGAAHCTHSTGTSGALTWRHRSRAEVVLINEVLGARTERADASGQGQDLVLSLTYHRHGMSLPIVSAAPVLPAGVTDEIELGQLLEMLGTELAVLGDLRRPTSLSGQAEDVALVAQAVLETGRRRSGRSIRRVVMGGRVNPTVSELVASAFPQAVQVERYSLSEVLGGASRVAPSPYLMLDGYVIGEVLDADGSPTPPGLPGELVLTELYPLVQLQPLIRYRTGDVVEAAGEGDLHLNGFRWWGRAGDCFPSAGGWMLRRSMLTDWLCGQPYVARAAHRPLLRSLGSTDVSEPCAVARWVRGTTEIIVGLRVNPWLDQPGTSRLVSHLWGWLPQALLGDATRRVRIGLAHHADASQDFAPGDARPVRWCEVASLGDSAPAFVDA